jgi:putative sigma-54 modulation protein
MSGSVFCRAQTIEVTIRSAKLGVVRAEETRDNLYAAIDVAGDKVARSLKKMKEKAVAKGNWPGRGAAKGAQKISDAFEVPDALDVASSVPTDSEKEEAMESLDMPQSVKKTKVFYLDAMSAKVPSHHVVHHDAIEANHVNGRVAHNRAHKVIP